MNIGDLIVLSSQVPKHEINGVQEEELLGNTSGYDKVSNTWNVGWNNQANTQCNDDIYLLHACGPGMLGMYLDIHSTAK